MSAPTAISKGRIGYLRQVKVSRGRLFSKEKILGKVFLIREKNNFHASFWVWVRAQTEPTPSKI
jgi:hypothetical protein